MVSHSLHQRRKYILLKETNDAIKRKGYTFSSVSDVQKQPFKGVLRKRCSENVQQIYRGTPLPMYDFNNVAKQLYWNRIEIASHTFRTSFPNNTSGAILLDVDLKSPYFLECRGFVDFNSSRFHEHDFSKLRSS